jgi:ATP-dependent DNA helicase DinG
LFHYRTVRPASFEASEALSHTLRKARHRIAIMLELEEIFGSAGPLKRALTDFRVRRQQLRMAERIAAALAGRETLIVEAGTGTGKTFAYLVPALMSGLRVLISTGTRTLQDQLFAKDLPLLGGALGRPARVALLKGRSNYLCRHRLARAGEGGEQLTLDGLLEAALEEEGAEDMLARIERWARTTRRGDLSEVAGLSDSHPVWPRVTSTRDNCLGARCSELPRCHLALARREALEADIVIVNHHLLLADLALKEDGFGDLLGHADAIILDEAHQIPDLATQLFGVNVGSRQIEGLVKDVQEEMAACLRHFSGASDAGAAARRGADAAREVEACMRDLRGSLPARSGRYAWADLSPESAAHARRLAGALELLQSDLTDLDSEGALAHLTERTGELLAALERVSAVDETDGTRAVEVSQRAFSLRLVPFDIADRFRSLVQSRPVSWIFTSATLSVGEDFGHFAGRLGLGSEATLKIDSPFDYEQQSLLYLPTGLPSPTAAGYGQAVIDTALPLIEATGGGAFVLFTSHRALAQAASLVRGRWGSDPPYRLFVQGEAPRERLLQAFREDGNAVLLGTASFWEGVDVKGTALRLVIIEKLPFASPEDPLVRARIEHLTASGGDAFRDYQLPTAVLALKQGVGRLIRSEDDHGVVVICDPRLLGRSYGRVFLTALPPMTVTCELEDAMRFLRRHAPPRSV